MSKNLSFKQDVRVNDYEEFQKSQIVFYPLKNNLYKDEIVREGKKYGLILSLEYSPQMDIIIIFGKNGQGHVWEFLRVENIDGSYKILDVRTLNEVRKILHYNRNARERKIYFREIREKRTARQLKVKEDACEDLALAARHGRSIFQRLSKAMWG